MKTTYVFPFLIRTTFLSSLKAAKDMFMAFANRSQAYGFHHSLGLTVFNTHFTVIQPLMRICECFKVWINKYVIF